MFNEPQCKSPIFHGKLGFLWITNKAYFNSKPCNLYKCKQIYLTISFFCLTL